MGFRSYFCKHMNDGHAFGPKAVAMTWGQNDQLPSAGFLWASLFRVMRSRVPAPPEVHPWDAEGALQQGRLVVRLGLETELSVTQPILRWGLWDLSSQSHPVVRERSSVVGAVRTWL